jgi:aspartyl-tRNA synthetase
MYRTHNCSELNKDHIGQKVTISGWLHSIRNHGGLMFFDIRDHYGITQCVFNAEINSHLYNLAKTTRVESVVRISGKVVSRVEGTTNSKIKTGDIEIVVEAFNVLSAAEILPMEVNSIENYSDEMRLTHRYLDLRRDKLHKNIVLRANVIAEFRKQMTDKGFLEYQTPILTASSPEGARDFLVPARNHPGKFYALPQAPQQFKQLLMVAGLHRVSGMNRPDQIVHLVSFIKWTLK